MIFISQRYYTIPVLVRVQSKDLRTDSEILHNEANKIRNYKKHKLNEDNDYNKRDYLFNHIYYSDDYETVVTDDYDDNV